MQPAKPRGRPKLSDENKKVRINITLNKSVYKKLKELKIKISPFVENLLINSLQMRGLLKNTATAEARVQVPAAAYS